MNAFLFNGLLVFAFKFAKVSSFSYLNLVTDHCDFEVAKLKLSHLEVNILKKNVGISFLTQFWITWCLITMAKFLSNISLVY